MSRDPARLLEHPELGLQLSPDEAAILLAKIEGAAAVLKIAAAATRQVRNGDESPTPDRLLTVDEAAPVLGLSKKALYARAAGLPFARRLGRGTLRFSEAGIQRWMRENPVDGKRGRR